MCRPAQCPTCNGSTWIGCGLHVATAFNGVPEEKYCTCGPKVEFQGQQFPPRVGSGTAGA